MPLCRVVLFRPVLYVNLYVTLYLPCGSRKGYSVFEVVIV